MRKECCLITIGNAGDRALPMGYKGGGYTAFPPQESGGSVSSSPSPAGKGHAQHWEMGMKDRVPPADPPVAVPIWGGSGWLQRVFMVFTQEQADTANGFCSFGLPSSQSLV